MPLPVIPLCHRVTLKWSDTDSGRSAVNVFHIQTNTAQTPLQLYTTINSLVTQAMWDWASGTAAVDTVTILPLDGVSAGVEFATGRPAKWTGGGLGQSIPQVAGLVKFTTGLRGASHRGRLFVPFVAEGEQDGGRLIDVAAVATAWATFNAALLATGAAPKLVVASYHLGSATVVTAISAEALTATQRRRQRS